jgi:hypothetical protein
VIVGMEGGYQGRIRRNEIVCKVPYPIKREFFDICKRKGKSPSDVIAEFTKNYVYQHTPTSKLGGVLSRVETYMEKHKRLIYGLFAYICVSEIFLTMLTVMPYLTADFGNIFIILLLVALLFFCAKIFMVLRKSVGEKQ